MLSRIGRVQRAQRTLAQVHQRVARRLLEGLDVLAGVDGFMITENEDSAAYQALVASKLWQRLPAVQAGNVTSLGGSTFYGSIYTISYVAQGWDALYNKIS